MSAPRFETGPQPSAFQPEAGRGDAPGTAPAPGSIPPPEEANTPVMAPDPANMPPPQHAELAQPNPTISRAEAGTVEDAHVEDKKMSGVTNESPDYIKSIYMAQANIQNERRSPKSETEIINATFKRANELTAALLSPEAQNNPDSLPLGDIGYELLALKLTEGPVPTKDEIFGLRKIVEAQKFSAKDMENEDIASIMEKTSADYWLISEEDRAFYKRILNAPSLGVAPPPSPAPVKRGKVKQWVWRNFANDRTAFTKAAPYTPGEASYLSPEDIARVKIDMWANNPRQKYHPSHSRLKKERPVAILGSVKEEVLARLELDKQLRQPEVDALFTQHELAQRAAARAEALGFLGVRNQVDQPDMEAQLDVVRSYNKRIKQPSIHKIVTELKLDPIVTRRHKVPHKD